ncbi:immunoglobulin-like domain-containing protein, partial [Cardiobacterium hominis]
TYKLTADDVGHKISVQATYDDRATHHETPVSAATASVQDANSTGNHAPEALKLDYGQDSDRSLSYWVMGGKAGDSVGKLSATDPDGDAITWRVSDPRFEIAGNALKLKDGVALDYANEKRVVMTVTAIDSHGAATSRDFAVQVRDPDTHNRSEDNRPGYLGVSGGTKIGDTLQAWFDDQDGKPQSGSKYQWYANGQAIAGATDDNYTLTAADVGKTIRVGIEYQDGKGHAEHLYSAPTAAISDNQPTATLHASANSIAEGESVTYTLSLDRPAERDMTYTIRAQHGSTSDGDINLSAQTVTIAKGASSATFSATANRDGTYENHETFAVSVRDENGRESRADVSIANTDAAAVPAAPTITRDGSGARITPASGADTLHYSYRDDSGRQHDINLDKRADGKWHSSSSGVDYDPHSGAVKLPAIQAGSDIFASNAAKGVYNDQPAHLLPQAADNSPLEAGLYAADPHGITEGGTASYIIRLNRPAEHDTVFNLEVRGKDADGNDLVTGTQQVTVRAGEQSAVATVQTHDDSLAERTETYKVVLYTHDSSVTVPAHRGSLTGEITDNDAIAPPTISADTLRPGGVLVAPGAGADSVTITYHDAQFGQISINAWKENGRWRISEVNPDKRSTAPEIDPDSGTVSLPPEIVRDGSTIRAYQSADGVRSVSASHDNRHDNPWLPEHRADSDATPQTVPHNDGTGAGRNIPVPNHDGWKLAWSDTFDHSLEVGDSSGKTWTRYGWGWQAPEFGGMGRYQQSNSFTADGVLHIRSQYTDGVWSSEGIGSGDLHAASGGRWEVRARFPNAKGIGYVFLLWPEGENWPPEVDFAEGRVRDPNIYATYHWGSVQDHKQAQEKYQNADLTDWHTYGAIIDPEKNTLTYTFDGQPIKTLSDPTIPISNQKFWLGMQTGSQDPHGSFADQESIDDAVPGKETAAASDIEIDWVAHYTPSASGNLEHHATPHQHHDSTGEQPA